MSDYVNIITSTDEETGTTNIYPIEGQRLSCGSVGDESHPVYFDGGVPVQCSGDIGGGGDTVIITPDADISSLNRSEKQEIATFQINDGKEQSLYIPRYSSGFQKVTLFEGGITTPTTGQPLLMDFTNFQFLYIYIKDTKNLVGTHVEIVPVPQLAERIPFGDAYVSCTLVGTLGMIIQFTGEQAFNVVQINNLPNYDSPDTGEGSIGVKLIRIEGYTLGISKGSWGVNTKESIWAPVNSEGGVVDPTIKYPFTNNHTLSEFDYIYVHGCISGETEEHIDVGAVDHFKDLFDKRQPAYLTCGTFQNITKTLLFEDDGFYIYAGNNVDNLTYNITRIEGIKFGAEINTNTIVDAVTDEDMHAVTSNAVYGALEDITPVDVVADGNMNPVTSNAVYDALEDLSPIDDIIEDAMIPVTSNAVYQAMSGLKLLPITQAQFDALTVKDPNTLYLIGEWT